MTNRCGHTLRHSTSNLEQNTDPYRLSDFNLTNQMTFCVPLKTFDITTRSKCAQSFQKQQHAGHLLLKHQHLKKWLAFCRSLLQHKERKSCRFCIQINDLSGHRFLCRRINQEPFQAAAKIPLQSYND